MIDCCLMSAEQYFKISRFHYAHTFQQTSEQATKQI